MEREEQVQAECDGGKKRGERELVIYFPFDLYRCFTVTLCFGHTECVYV